MLIFIAAAVVATFRPREAVFLPDGFCVLFVESLKIRPSGLLPSSIICGKIGVGVEYPVFCSAARFAVLSERVQFVHTNLRTVETT